MSKEIRLGDYATTPLYNIKAVVQATGISSSTLRAWERRYEISSPHRSENGYRLYSDRDVVLIRWLKTQVDAGMSISQAVTWFQTLEQDADALEAVALPESRSELTASKPASQSAPSTGVRSLAVLKWEIFAALEKYDEGRANRRLDEALALYTIEQVGEGLIVPVLVEVGNRWHRGELSATQEHFITNFLRQRLLSILRIVAHNVRRPLIWVGCAPGELHEIGAILLSIYLRRAGHNVTFLGQNLPQDEFVDEVKRIMPAMVLFSATTIEAIDELKNLAVKLTEMKGARPIIGYGGQAFNALPERRNNMRGIFLGTTVSEAVDVVNDLLSDSTSRSGAA